MQAEHSLRALSDRPPFGYLVLHRDDDWWLEVDPEQAVIVKELADRLIAGESLTAIATDLSDRGVPTPYDWNRQRSGRDPRGGRWSIDTLRAVIGPHLDGRYVVDADGHPVVKAPAILDPATYADLETELHQRKTAPLHGIVRCAAGEWLQLVTVAGRPPQQCDYQCSHLSIPAWWLEGDVSMIALATVADAVLVDQDGTTGETFEQAWCAAERQDKAVGSWARRRALLRAGGLIFTVDEETAGARSRLHGRLGIYRYSVQITLEESTADGT
jgi:hypothetical protein